MSGASFGDDRGHADAAATHNRAASAFVEGNEAVDFQPRHRDETYGFVRETLERFGYRRLGKRDKGVALKFLAAATGVLSNGKRG